MFVRVLLRLLIVVPTSVAAVLIASLVGDAVVFELRILAGALSFSAVVTARDNRTALRRAAVCVALSLIVSLLVVAGASLIARS